MNALLTLQRKFQADVLAERRLHAAEIAGPAQDDAEARLAIYSNAYRLRLVAALRADYPKLCALLGDEAFHALACAYLERHPPSHPNIRWVGRRLPGFLGEQEPYRSDPALAELAAFERALRDAFDAEDAPVLAGEALAAIPPQSWASMRPVLHPSVHRLDLGWNTVVVWQALDRGEPPPRPQALERRIPWLVWRKDFTPRFRSLAPAEAGALDAVRGGVNVQTLCERASRWSSPEQVPAQVAGWLAAWLLDGMISAIES